MEKKSRINWWIVAAVIVIGVPVGYVASGVVKQLVSRNQSTETDSTEIVKHAELDNNVVIVKSEKDTLLASAEKDTPVSKSNTIKDSKPETGIISNQVADTRPGSNTIPTSTVIVDPKPAPTPPKPDPAEPPKPIPPTPVPENNNEEIRIAKENKISSAVVSGRKDALVPAHCTIVVNGKKSMDYQNFCQGVRLKAYSNVKVISVTFDNDGNANKVVVKATINQDE